MDEYEIQEPNKSARNIAYLIVAVLLVVALVAFVYYETKVNKPASSESREVKFTVQKGLRTKQVAYELRDQKIISSPLIFLIYSSLHSANGKIQAGDYSLNGNMAMPEIIDVLTQGKVVPNARSVTIIEGWTNKQIAAYLVSRQIINVSSDFDAAIKQENFDFKFEDAAKEFNYQGFLFPDTYKLGLDAGIAELIGKMLADFESKITDKMLSDITSESRDVKKVIILASIIEKEVGRNKQQLTDDDLKVMQDERELVASVFYNRLEIGMRLESDATVNYVTGKADRSVTIEDSKAKSPYNTYTNYGLPPGPICNPGLGSIEAAIYPTASDYLFFLNKPDGEAVFSKTLSEHNANKAKYLK